MKNLLHITWAWLLLGSLAWAQGPKVERVDPPNWWIGLPPPMLLIKGEGLEGAKVTSASPGVRVSRVEEGLNGHYLFVWLEIAKTATPGKAKLQVVSEKGRSSAEIEINPLARSGGGSAEGDILFQTGQGTWQDLAHIQPRLTGQAISGIVLRVPYAVDGRRPSLSMNAVTDFYPRLSEWGRIDDLAGLSRMIHDAGGRVQLRVEANQVGVSHAWVADPPHERWFNGTREHHLKTDGDLSALADPHAPQSRTRPLLEGWLDDSLADLNTQDPWVAQYLRQQMMWWVMTAQADALALEDLPYVDRGFWSEFTRELRKTFPKVRTIGEVQSREPEVVASFAGGRSVGGVDTDVTTMIDVPLAAAVRESVEQGKGANRIEAVLQKDWLYPKPESLLLPLMGIEDRTAAELAAQISLLLPRVPLLDDSLVFSPAGEVALKTLRLRRQHPALSGGKMYHLISDDTVFVFGRDHFAGAEVALGQSSKPEHLLIVVNVGRESRKLTLEVADTPIMTATEIRDVLPAGTAKAVQGKIEVEITARSVAVWDVRCGCDVDDTLTPARPR
ncbi:MAG: cyclomaltodextrinase N-terminal domain-containing protein [Acidobacteriales bacterium]|nr:cyclomaltodextrinase N-terminal domain-containing protein [Terriglobales bacterium]